MESTLWRLRRATEALATPSGTFRVVDERSGLPPVPAGGLRFADRRTATLAASLVRAHRRALRERDPRASAVSLVVEHVGAPAREETPAAERAVSGGWSL